ncbi:hypothetical protein T11_754 [Trichinella zimbabwensis]|uniref:Uncharacterized protein n=1 Tax=Trichinella zimbabwensis TaxID=268475 RepID=A0A0V1GSE1_9BILA|nr:hypothetical protein T11_754 [Trichinella zimbabwensis]
MQIFIRLKCIFLLGFNFNNCWRTLCGAGALAFSLRRRMKYREWSKEKIKMQTTRSKSEMSRSRKREDKR